MKKVFTILVTVDDTQRIENTLNKLRIGLNDWDKTRVFNVHDMRLINYTIICEETTYNTIVECINGTRVY